MQQPAFAEVLFNVPDHKAVKTCRQLESLLVHLRRISRCISKQFVNISKAAEPLFAAPRAGCHMRSIQQSCIEPPFLRKQAAYFIEYNIVGHALRAVTQDLLS